jgi:hypothetical protein
MIRGAARRQIGIAVAHPCVEVPSFRMTAGVSDREEDIARALEGRESDVCIAKQIEACHPGPPRSKFRIAILVQPHLRWIALYHPASLLSVSEAGRGESECADGGRERE